MLTASHFYAEVLAYQGEQRGAEVNLAVTVHRHIHSDEFLVRQPVRALVTKPQRRVHVLQHVIYLRVMYLAGGIRIVLGPDPDELVEMMSAQNRRIAGEVIEVVHDDGDEEIQHEERAEEDEGDEVDVGDIGAAIVRFLRLLGLGVARLALYAGQHDVRPGLARCTPGVKLHRWIERVPSTLRRLAVSRSERESCECFGECIARAVSRTCSATLISQVTCRPFGFRKKRVQHAARSSRAFLPWKTAESVVVFVIAFGRGRRTRTERTNPNRS